MYCLHMLLLHKDLNIYLTHACIYSIQTETVTERQRDRDRETDRQTDRLTNTETYCTGTGSDADTDTHT